MEYFDYEYRIIYGDTDKMGISYYGNYFRWFEGARTEYFRALGLLYPDELPVRGQVEVSLPDPASAGTTGVVGAIASLLTGAAGEGGFHGLAGQHVRRGLLRFDVAEATALCFRRTDTGTRVQAEARLKHVAGDPRTMPLLQRCLAGQASSDERAEFGRLWQARVARILLEHAHDDAVFRLSRFDS